MSTSIKTYVLKGFDEEQTQFIAKTLDFLSGKLGINNHSQIIDNLNIELQPNEYLLLVIDELSVSQFNENINQSFFDKKQFRNNQIIIILDDINIKQLPQIFHYFPVYPLVSNFSFSENTNNEVIQNQAKTRYIEILHDVIHFIKKSKLNAITNESLVFVGPYDDNTTFEFHKITRELIHRKCNIAPTIFNPSGLELIENEAFFNNLIENIELAIHFIGYASLQKYPDEKSAAIKINEKVAAHCRTQGGAHIQRIIYIPAIDEETPEIIRQKISAFKSNPKNLENAELVQTPVEKFKDLVVSKLSKLSDNIETKERVNIQTNDVYIIHPPNTEKNVDNYLSWFTNNKIQVSTSQANLDQLELLHYHQKKLTTCKGVVILNSSNPQWLQRKISDLKKAPGWGRKKPFAFKIIIGENNKEIIAKKIEDTSITWIKENQWDSFEKLMSKLSLHG